jgi:hypothetical protein
MDTTQECEHLAHAEQQIVEFRQRVVEQEAVVDQLTADGHDVRAPEGSCGAFRIRCAWRKSAAKGVLVEE